MKLPRGGDEEMTKSLPELRPGSIELRTQQQSHIILQVYCSLLGTSRTPEEAVSTGKLAEQKSSTDCTVVP